MDLPLKPKPNEISTEHLDVEDINSLYDWIDDYDPEEEENEEAVTTVLQCC